MYEKMQQVCRIIGQADELVIITKNLYGEYSAAVKNILERSIGTSTPFSTYRNIPDRKCDGVDGWSACITPLL